jgi:hypothetical protein
MLFLIGPSSDQELVRKSPVDNAARYLRVFIFDLPSESDFRFNSALTVGVAHEWTLKGSWPNVC